MRQKYDHILIGLGSALAVPVAGYGILLTIYDQLDQWGLLDGTGFSPNFRVRTLALVAICLNLILIRYFMRRYASRSMRGVLLATFIYAGIWLFYFNVISF